MIVAHDAELFDANSALKAAIYTFKNSKSISTSGGFRGGPAIMKKR